MKYEKPDIHHNYFLKAVRMQSLVKCQRHLIPIVMVISIEKWQYNNYTE